MEVRNQLHTPSVYVYSTALYGAKTWTLQNVDQKYLKSFEVCFWRGL